MIILENLAKNLIDSNEDVDQKTLEGMTESISKSLQVKNVFDFSKMKEFESLSFRVNDYQFKALLQLLETKEFALVNYKGANGMQCLTLINYCKKYELPHKRGQRMSVGMSLHERVELCESEEDSVSMYSNIENSKLRFIITNCSFFKLNR